MSTTLIELPIDGMTCASCARRVESALNRVDGATAHVNFATEIASVQFDPEHASADDLRAAVRASGYEARAATPSTPHHAPPDHAGVRAAIALACAAPTAAITMAPGFAFTGADWTAAALATVVTWWAAWPIHHAAARGARHGSLGMDALVSIGVLAAWTWSAAVIMTNGSGAMYFESAAVVAAFVLTGRWLESRAKHDSTAALRALSEYAAGTVTRLDAAGEEQRISADQLRSGDRFVVRPGERVAADGIVDAGRSTIDQSLVTGESMPVAIAPGHEVLGGTMNADGRLVVRATRIGSDTALATIGRLLAGAQSSSAPTQRLVDRISSIFVPIVLALAAATLIGWVVAGAAPGRALEVAIAVLVIACPCALGLATPMALLAGTLRGARHGIVVSSAAALEQTRRIDTIILDKTGTVTTGLMSVHDVVTADGVDEREVLTLGASVEAASEHPIAAAITAAARDRSAPVHDVDQFSIVAGHGAIGDVDGRTVIVGRPELLDAHAVTISSAMHAAFDRAAVDGRTAVFVAWDGAARGVITCADDVRDTSEAAVAALRALDIEPILVTGDNAGTAARIADAVGITRVRAHVTPGGKVEIVRELQRDGRRVAMLGDGVNDAPALAQADLGIAMGSGTDVAIAASDITLLHADPLDAARAIRLARRTVRTIRGNLVWAFAYNVAALPLAVAGIVDPMIAGGAMAMSSLFVVGNSLRLRHAGRV